MSDTDLGTRNRDHGSEEDWVDFARGQAGPGKRSPLENHLETGCSRCAKAVRLWRAVWDAAAHEAAYRPPDAVLRQLAGVFALRRPKGLIERAALVFDSLRRPQPAGVRSSGAGPRQLLYCSGPYRIRLSLEPGQSTDALSIVGQILDTADPTAALDAIAVTAWAGTETLDRTLTNPLGEFVLEAAAAEDLQLKVGETEIAIPSGPPRGDKRRSGWSPTSGRSTRGS